MPTYRYRDKDYSLFALRRQFPHISFPASPAPDDLAPFGVTIMPDPEPLPPSLEEAKAIKLSQINAACQHALEALTPTYPEREIATFDKQEAEARAYAADPTAPTPLLSALSQARGVPLDELVLRVLMKADAFAVASGGIIGQRQALEDRLDACTTVEELEALEATISFSATEGTL